MKENWLCCGEDITTYTRWYVLNSTSHWHLVSTWDNIVQRKLCELRMNINLEAVLRRGYLCCPCLSDLQCLQRDFTTLSVNSGYCCWFNDGSLVRHCICRMPHNVILQSDWFAKISGILHNAVNTILPGSFSWGWSLGCETRHNAYQLHPGSSLHELHPRPSSHDIFPGNRPLLTYHQRFLRHQGSANRRNCSRLS